MITSELATVWITSDGKRYFTEKEAELHEQKNEENKEKLTWLERLRQK